MCPEFFFPTVGGGEVFHYEVGRRLASRGHDVHIITYRHRERRCDEIVEGMHVHRVGGYIVTGSQPYFKRALVQGLGILKVGAEIDFDILQANQTFPLLPSNLLSKVKKRPIIAVYHDVYGYQFSLKDLGLLKGIVRGAVERASLELNYDAIIAVSNSTKEKLLTQGVADGKIKVIHEGVDIEKIDRVAGERSFTPTILFVGRLVPHKHVDDLLTAFKSVLNYASNAKLVIVGTGPLRQRLEDQANSLGIIRNVSFTGYISDDVKFNLMKQAHALVLPSVMEGFGLVLIEAMACRTPVIAVDKGGPREIVMNGVNGYLVPSLNPPALAEKILAILFNEDLREGMGRTARRYVEERFTWEATTEKIEALYRSLAG